MPRANKQEQRLRRYLERYRHVDPLTAWQELGIYRLAAAVHRLRSTGMQIRTLRRTAKNKFGESVCFAVYVYVPRGNTDDDTTTTTAADTRG